MAKILIPGQSYKDNNGEVRSSIYGILSRTRIDFIDKSATLFIDNFPNEDIRNLNNCNKRIGEIRVDLNGAEFETHLAAIKKIVYDAMDAAQVRTGTNDEGQPIMKDAIDKTIFKSDE